MYLIKIHIYSFKNVSNYIFKYLSNIICIFIVYHFSKLIRTESKCFSYYKYDVKFQYAFRGRVQTTWSKFWGILTPPPPLWTLLLNNCYYVLRSSEQPPSPSFVHVVCTHPLRDIQERRKRRLHRTSVMKNNLNKQGQIEQTKKDVIHEIIPLCNLENAQEQNLNHHPIRIIIRWLSDILSILHWIFPKYFVEFWALPTFPWLFDVKP